MRRLRRAVRGPAHPGAGRGDAAEAAPAAAPEGVPSCKSARRLRARGRAAHGRRRRASSAARAPVAGRRDRRRRRSAPPPTTTRRSADVPPAAPAPVSAEGGRCGGAVPDFSGTNTQEVDVDEPDILKTDGRRIFAVTDRTLRVIDVAGGDGDRDARARRRRAPPAAARRPRAGDRRQGRAPDDAPSRRRPVAPTVAPLPSTTIVTEIDVSRPRRRCCARWRCPGRFVDARQNGGDRAARDRRRAAADRPARRRAGRRRSRDAG